MAIVKMSERGQIVIPQEIREKMDLQKGRRLFLEFSAEDMTIRLRLAGQPNEIRLRGFLKDSNVLELRREEREKEIRKDDDKSRG